MLFDKTYAIDHNFVHILSLYSEYILMCRGSSVVEQKPEELCVVGSIPTPGTILRQGFVWQAIFFKDSN